MNIEQFAAENIAVTDHPPQKNHLRVTLSMGFVEYFVYEREKVKKEAPFVKCIVF